MRDAEETVIDPTVDPSGGEPTSPAKGQEKPKEQPIDPKEFRAMQVRLTEQDRRIQELTESERYWSDRARGGAAPEPEETPDPEDPEDEPQVRDDKPEKLVDDISNKGIQALVERGVITRKQAKELIAKEVEKQARKVVEEVVGRERTKLTVDAEIMTKYPELRDEKSPLFAKTRDIYKEVVRRNPAKANDPEALLDAAERARLTLEIESLKSGRSAEHEEEPEPAERNRQDRIRAQASDRGRRSSEFEADDSRLGDEAREVIRQMGITEDDFRDSRQRLGVASRRSR